MGGELCEQRSLSPKSCFACQHSAPVGQGACAKKLMRDGWEWVEERKGSRAGGRGRVISTSFRLESAPFAGSPEEVGVPFRATQKADNDTSAPSPLLSPPPKAPRAIVSPGVHENLRT